jgi:hypothetical protein
MQQQIHRRRGAAAGEQAIVFAQGFAFVHAHIGIALAEQVRESPVRGGARAGQQPVSASMKVAVHMVASTAPCACCLRSQSA